MPSDVYLKSKRNLILFSGILLVSLTIGIRLETEKSVLPFALTEPERLSDVLGVMVIYFLAQISLFWSAQNAEVKNLIQYRLDYILTLVVASLSLAFWTYGYFASAIAQILSALVKAESDYGDILKWISILASTIASLSGVLVLSQIGRRLIFRGREKNESDERELLKLLLANQWNFLFNPESGARKALGFHPDGVIGVGKNHNEHSWRVRGRYLEIINSEGKVYSRFMWHPNENALIHTNDDDTLSLRSQRIEKVRT